MLAHSPTEQERNKHRAQAWPLHARTNDACDPTPAQEISETVDQRIAFLKQNGCSELVIESVLKNVDPY